MEVRNMSNYYAPKSAQGYMNAGAASSAMGGSACGAGDEEKKEDAKPSACGAGDGE